MNLSKPLASLLLIVALGLAACDDGGGQTDQDTHSGSDVMEMGCGTEPVDTYAVGLEKATDDGTYTLRFVSATPAPPDKGMNSWQVELVDGSGAAMADMDVKVAPFMPAHDHGTSPAEFVATGDGAGMYTIEDVNLFMPGRWELRFTVTDDAQVEHEATFAFCVEG